MNIQEMQVSFLTGLKSDYNIEFDIPTVQIDFFLNEAQRRIVEDYYAKFEIDEKARKALSNLVVSADITRATGVYGVQTGAVPNGEFWELPTDAAYCLKEEATLNIDACKGISAVPANWQRVYVKPINMDYYSLNIDNPFKKPYEGVVWRMDNSNKENTVLHQLITGGTYRVQTYHITYLAYPTAMSIYNDVDCVLPVFLHQPIVDEAVKVALEVLQTNKIYKSNSQ